MKRCPSVSEVVEALLKCGLPAFSFQPDGDLEYPCIPLPDNSGGYWAFTDLSGVQWVGCKFDRDHLPIGDWDIQTGVDVYENAMEVAKGIAWVLQP